MPRTRAPVPAPTPDHDAKGYMKEADVLHPVDKRKPDEDWPTFPIRNVTVFSKLLTSLENLLMVEQRGPFPIRGRVVIDRTDTLHVEALRSSRIPRYIDMELIAYRMSIGYDLDPDAEEEVPVPAVWAATDYGFFRLLQAAPDYTPILDKTFEAITLYYTVQDIYGKYAEEEGKRRRGLDLDEVLFRYAVDTGEAVVKEEVIDRCQEHSEFLASHFPKDTEFDWSGKAFTYWVQTLAKQKKARRTSSAQQTAAPAPAQSQPASLPRRSRSAAHDDAKAPATTTATTAPPARTTRQSSSMSAKSQNSTVASTGSKTQRGSSQARVSSPKPAAATKPTAPPKPAAPVAPPPSTSGEQRSEETALKLYNAVIDTADSDPIDRITTGNITSKLYFKYKFAAYKGAAEAMRYYAMELVNLMDGDSERATEWKASRIYQDLASTPRMEAHELEHLTPDKIEPSLVRRRPGQQTRPKGPQAEKTSKTPTSGYQSASDTSGHSRRGRPSGVGGLRLAATVPTKRFRGDHDGGRATKSSKRSHGMAYEEEELGEGSAETDEESSSEEMASDGEPDQAPVRIAIDVERVPSTRPNDADGVWECDQDGCGYVVADADDAEGQMEVRTHLHEHEETSERVKLAITEGHAAGHRSIEYLLEKLKQIGGKEHVNPELGPEPIKREHGLLF